MIEVLYYFNNNIHIDIKKPITFFLSKCGITPYVIIGESGKSKTMPSTKSKKPQVC